MDSPGEEAPTTSRIVRPEQVPVRDVWPREDQHFTPWLAANLDWLDLLEIGRLTAIGVEVAVPGVNRSLDILAETGTGQRVAIENQYAEADHDHFTRGLAYAVGLDTTALVVIAERHRPEFIAVADYLNKAREAIGEEEGIAVFLLNVTVEGIGEYRVPRFEVLSRPNTWLTEVHDSGMRASHAGAFPSVDAFLAASPPDRRDAFAAIIADWLTRPGADLNIKTTVSLRIPNPYLAISTPRSFFLLERTGSLGIQRGYLIETGAFPDTPAVDLLDSKIDEYFGQTYTGAKHYYVATKNPSPQGVREFTDWVLEYFERADRSA